MGTKVRNTNYDVLDKILSDSDLAQRGDGKYRSAGNDESAEGAWITSKEQFDKHYKAVDDIEKYLRS